MGHFDTTAKVALKANSVSLLSPSLWESFEARRKVGKSRGEATFA